MGAIGRAPAVAANQKLAAAFQALPDHFRRAGKIVFEGSQGLERFEGLVERGLKWRQAAQALRCRGTGGNFRW